MLDYQSVPETSQQTPRFSVVFRGVSFSIVVEVKGRDLLSMSYPGCLMTGSL